jgi:SAM-dependent methyltransferase
LQEVVKKSIDFDRVARWYDLHVRADFDQAFWVEQARSHPGRRLELMCGTGRLSLPILEAGLELTCVDYSEGMLALLREKLAVRGLAAEVLEKDVRDLQLSGFDFAFIGFNSFSELPTRGDQLAALGSIHAALRAGGRLTLSLHNPTLRARQLDGEWRESGPFPLPGGGELRLRGSYLLHPETGSVTGTQHYEERDAAGALVRELDLPMRFRLPGATELESLAAARGFEPVRWWGDYDGSPLDAATSPFILCELRRR